MKVLTGHLTATDKKAIKAIMEAGLMKGKVGRKSYFITKSGDVYSVKYTIMDRGMISVPGSPLRLSTYSSSFKL